MATILIVDDDPQIHVIFEKILTEEAHSVLKALSGEEVNNLVESHSIDLVITDVNLPGISGIEALQKIKQIEPKLPVIVMTAFGTTDTAIEATKQGAFDYILKPFNIPEILKLVEQALEAGRFMRTPVQMDAIPETEPAEVMIGRSTVMQEVYKAIGKVAPTDTTVLIRGESGTGKELVARALYQHSLRSEQPFMVINCVAIPETLLESELFGYEKGSFTGATRRRVGKVEQARGGTIFLDEIGDMPISIQAKILRLLEEKTIERLGGEGLLKADVRIIAATNRNLEDLLKMGLFREDLFYRLNVVTIKLPSLRERPDDIPLLSHYFVTKYAREMSLQNPGLTDSAIALLRSNAWPGNVRELANTLQKSLIFSRGSPISAEDITGILNSESRAQDHADAEEVIKRWVRLQLRSQSVSDLFNTLSDHFSRIVIREVLDHTQGNQSLAAKILGLSRPTLQAKIQKYDLAAETRVKKDGPA